MADTARPDWHHEFKITNEHDTGIMQQVYEKQISEAEQLHAYTVHEDEDRLDLFQHLHKFEDHAAYVHHWLWYLVTFQHVSSTSPQVQRLADLHQALQTKAHNLRLRLRAQLYHHS